ncbi:hypothetical protein O7634_12805 [Micromonospora sp. WMMD1120]|uniref:hypothetical protein n=1 Tax=Micromonospora sp. WMMD1120 TaxID=3016106 RepID=UPI002416FA35|nr:hypothetical protein [Micromonospora sp. WMMD1120]MDG4807632.1 hypothetical protein [Micromonospora sp. WMMD1120]
MSGIQVTFAIIGAVLALGSLAWTITWAIKSFRKGGAEISAELGQGYVDEHGTLQVHFRDGRSKIMRVEGDPWDKRKGLKKAPAKKKRRKVAGAPDQEHDWMPVNAIFARNSGRMAVTVSRCFYVVELDLGTSFQFEPQPYASPWGDLLPKRVESGEEIVVLHEKENMSGLLNAALRDHGVFQTVYGVYLELGNGQTVYAGPPIGIQAYMDDEEYVEVEKQLTREVYEGPGSDEESESQRKRRRYEKWHAENVVMIDDLTPDQLQALRGKTAARLLGKPQPFTDEERRLPG